MYITNISISLISLKPIFKKFFTILHWYSTKRISFCFLNSKFLQTSYPCISKRGYIQPRNPDYSWFEITELRKRQKKMMMKILMVQLWGSVHHTIYHLSSYYLSSYFLNLNLAAWFYLSRLDRLEIMVTSFSMNAVP